MLALRCSLAPAILTRCRSACSALRRNDWFDAKYGAGHPGVVSARASFHLHDSLVAVQAAIIPPLCSGSRRTHSWAPFCSDCGTYTKAARGEVPARRAGRWQAQREPGSAVRGFFYAALAVLAFIFAPAIDGPWPVDVLTRCVSLRRKRGSWACTVCWCSKIMGCGVRSEGGRCFSLGIDLAQLVVLRAVLHDATTGQHLWLCCCLWMFGEWVLTRAGVCCSFIASYRRGTAMFIQYGVKLLGVARISRSAY